MVRSTTGEPFPRGLRTTAQRPFRRPGLLRTAAASFAGLVFLLAACGDGTTEQSGEAEFDAGLFLLSSEPVPSVIRGFPVPGLAIFEGERLGVEALANDSVTDYGDYRLPPGFTVDQIDAWYQKYQPPGEAFADWTWCGREPFDDDAWFDWWWRPGTDQMLGYFIGEGNPVDGLPSVAIQVIAENSGPC